MSTFSLKTIDHDNQQAKILENLSKLLKLVIEYEKKYENKLSPFSNFYY